ncbi:RidA family protein [Phycisphaera mikurensis]|uniref:RidA family protein n=1 Tax=Phycisphaera mikurensis (strain NBRC 102666 / KCTC 22515 / FYK2301M01) TaxID=1142394 RepID=I0ICV6_PHYMF|nr:RidA family protein [Phycisphaera mikurensis]MBB6442225.1 2-iminobutanoate/2-iminopropanoate deaminase [Phycisphaera mikurensis]BAM03094.1 hypothetical protein PSMK_09350 [Phycisphaera mikurensis NBRC 102666]
MPEPDLRVIDPDPNLPISTGVVHNGLFYVSGHVGFWPGTSDPIAGDLAAQTRQTLADLDAAMEKAGTHRGRIVTMRVFLAEVQRDFAEMNKVFREWIGDHRPARTTVGSSLAVPGLLIEIDAVVAMPAEAG